jgi:formate hydrogenlyase transcriptional activator
MRKARRQVSERDEQVSEEIRLTSLFGVIDLAGPATRLDDVLPDLAACLRAAVDFDLLAVVLPDHEWKSALLHAVRPDASSPAPPAAEVRSIPVAPLDKERLAAAAEGQHQGIVLDRLDADGGYPDVVAALRELGQRSARLLPLATALGPVGLFALASSREGACGRCDLGFLQHAARQVALAIDNVRHQEQALARERQFQAEREHLRTLLELTNAVVTTRDLPALLRAIGPHLERVVSYDAASVYLLEAEGARLGAYAISPMVVGWTHELASLLHPETEPFATWLAERRAVDVDLERFDWTGREAIRTNLEANAVKRIGIVPLATPRGPVGFLVLDRREARPFTPEELDRTTQVAGQIAIVVENALAFGEIAALKDRLAHENIYLEEEIRDAQHFGEIVGESNALKQILRQVSSVGATDTTVLLLGETGTGKELVARAIHAASQRRSRTLVTVNCAPRPWGCSRASGSAMRRGRSRGRSRRRSAGSSWRTRARCSWTRSATCRSSCSPSCCGCCRSARSSAWAARGPSAWTSG